MPSKPASVKKTVKQLSPIAATASVVNSVVNEQISLPDCLTNIQDIIQSSDAAKVQAYSYNVLRHYEYYQFIVNSLLDKKLKNKDQDIYHLILCGVMLLNESHLPSHAAINETVNVTKKSKKSWSKNLVNALLRRYQREQKTLDAAAMKNPCSRYCCPQWLIEKIKLAYPDKPQSKSLWQAILLANKGHPPMSLRVNQLVISRDAYLQRLNEHDIAAIPCELTHHGVILQQAMPVESLPLFAEGGVSVQDSAAQLCTELLGVQAGQRVLDACAAPGGKTLHLIETCPELNKLVAIDVSAKRLSRVTDNINRLAARLESKVELIAADAGQTEDWWDNAPFDRILLDAPCSATGVIRRHPDIKRLRKSAHIDELVITQQTLLQQLWPTLKTGGYLLYSTCSILPEENTLQIKRFLSEHNDAQSIDFDVSWGLKTDFGRQLLPSQTHSDLLMNKRNSDGFYYCLLKKI